MQEAMNHLTTKVTGVAASGGVVAPTTLYGEFLTTHGLWLLSYAELMKIVGTFYILFLLMKPLVNLVRKQYNKWFKKE